MGIKMCSNVLILFLISFLSVSKAEEKMKVTILFEALCPDSKSFIREQLSPAWKDIEKDLNLELVPFGKAMSVNNGESFICQHGEDECEKNKLMSCALNQISNSTKQVKFIKCSMTAFLNWITTKDEKINKFKKCVEDASLLWTDLENCDKSELGKDLQLNAEHVTMKYNPSFIPTIVFNNVFNQTVQDESLYDFKKTALAFINKNDKQAITIR